MLRTRHYPSWTCVLLLMSAVFAFPSSARAFDVDLKLEPGAALTLAKPQNQRFQLGGAATLKALFGSEDGYVNFGPGLTFLGLPAQSGLDAGVIVGHDFYFD